MILKLHFSKKWQKWIVYYQTIWGQTQLLSTHDTKTAAQKK